VRIAYGEGIIYRGGVFGDGEGGRTRDEDKKKGKS